MPFRETRFSIVRFEQLDIEGFGRLHDISFTFEPGLTCIIGPNESGKSTLHRAIRAALYGIDAGRPGKAARLSPWSRWSPWDAPQYGLSLTYRLDTDRQYRVARRLTHRTSSAQVLEIGGGDITNTMHVGKLVVPGFHHLGLEEDVFAATAWLSEDGLLISSPEGMQNHVDLLRATIERLVDGGISMTARDALDRLAEADASLGTPRRSSSPLGLVLARIDELTVALEEATTFHSTMTHDVDQLALLHHEAQHAREEYEHLQQQWIITSIALSRHHLEELRTIEREEAQLMAHEPEREAALQFNDSSRATLATQRADLDRFCATRDAAEERWNRAQVELQPLREERATLARGLHHLLPELTISPEQTAQIDEYRDECSRLEGEAGLADDARLIRLQGKIHALEKSCTETGYDSIPTAEIQTFLEEPVHPAPVLGRRTRTIIALAGTAIGAVAGLLVGILDHMHELLVPGGAGILLGLLISLLITGVLVRMRTMQSRSTASPIQGSTLDREDLLRSLRSLLRLREELSDTRIEVTEYRNRIDDLAQRIGILHEHVCTLMDELGIAFDESNRPAPTVHDPRQVLAVVKLLLGTIDERKTHAERRVILAAHDAALADQERLLLDIEQDWLQSKERATRHGEQLKDRLLSFLPGTSGTLESLIELYDSRCAAKDAALEEIRTLQHLRQRRAVIPQSPAALEQRIAYLEQELASHGTPHDIEREPSSFEDLPALEEAARLARDRSDALARNAQQLSSVLQERNRHGMSIADIRDDLASACAERDAILLDKAALSHAMDTLRELSSDIHHDVADRLQSTLAASLPGLTGGRYRDCSIDPETFTLRVLGPESPEYITLDLVSHGTRDQIHLLLRIALATVLGTRRETIPLLLDEPLLTADPKRQQAYADFLIRMSSTHQIILTATSDSILRVLEEVSKDQIHVIWLDSPNQGASTHLTEPSQGITRPEVLSAD